MQIIPVASGKGGVGKSLLSANLAVALGQAGKKVILADLDLGASNLHLAIGVSPKTGIGTFLTGGSTFEEIITPTDYENVSFIAGDSEIPGLSTLKVAQKNALIRKFHSLKADYLIIDLGAGTQSGRKIFLPYRPRPNYFLAESVPPGGHRGHRFQAAVDRSFRQFRDRLGRA